MKTKSTERRKTAWETKCEAAAEKAGVGDAFFPDGDKPSDRSDCFEDDGNLHIHVKGKPWVCFGIGQDTPGVEANQRTRVIMEALGLGKKINDRVLVEETDGEDEVCPHCGRGGRW